MTNFELIDDFLTGRLSGAEKEAFEKQLAADPALKAEVQLQQQVVEGVRKARAAELKAMLNNVPVSSGLNLSTTQWIAGTATIAIVGVASYFLLSSHQQQPATEQQVVEQKVAEPQLQPQEPANTETATQPEKQATSEPQSEKKTEEKKETVAAPVTQPKLDLIDPSDELADSDRQDNAMDNVTGNRTELSKVEIKVVTDSKYDNHYQRVDNTVVLYGKFDKSLYEIIEIHGDEHLVFLFHNNTYYQLEEDTNAIQKLNAIQDQKLIAKLRERRKK